MAPTTRMPYTEQAALASDLLKKVGLKESKIKYLKKEGITYPNQIVSDFQNNQIMDICSKDFP
jgi:hypothetical protein